MAGSVKGRLAAAFISAVVAVATPIVVKYEGVSLISYLDPVRIPTICAGITSGVQLGDIATPAECDAKLEAELTSRLIRLGECIHADLAVHQWAAVLSWAYNIGTGAACGSTLARMINTGQPSSVWCQQLTRWVYAGGQVLDGLVLRRRGELALCMGQPQ